MAGPCSVESGSSCRASPRRSRRPAPHLLRGGAFKPRTSPYAFQGLEEEGSELLADARKETGLPVVTEVLEPDKVGLVAEYADVLQIGARNCQNFSLLKEVGQCGKPVLLKRGMATTIKEFLLSAEYVLAGGNPNVILCERGIRTFETTTRYTLDLNAVPVIKKLSHLPVVVDPSHGAGDRGLVEPLAARPPPSAPTASSSRSTRTRRTRSATGPQALEAAHFAEYARDVAAHAQLLGKRLA